MFEGNFKLVDGREFTKDDVLGADAKVLVERIRSLRRNGGINAVNVDFAIYCLHYAEQLRYCAGYNGAYNDGGASALEDKVEAWISGLEDRVPDCFVRLQQKYERDANDEYAKYLELKKKFEK